ncbi:MAG: Antitoxin of type system, VapB [Ignavibacteria bacterium]|nr:Antitoxin of type system, VapB [Ignavibacteria bacterium]
MRTTLNIQDGIIEDILLYYNAKTKTEAVNKALIDWVNYTRKNKLLSLRGQVEVDDNTELLKLKEIEEMKRNE